MTRHFPSTGFTAEKPATKLHPAMWFCFAGLTLCCQPAASETNVETLRKELRAAHADNDAARLSAAARALRSEFAGHPAYLFHAARGAALSGESGKSLELLLSIVERGVDMQDAVARDDAFARLQGSAGYAAFQDRTARLREQAGTAQVSITAGPPDTQPEGIAFDTSGNAYISSVRRGEIIRKKQNGGTTAWPIPGRWSAQGLHFSNDGRVLWAATSAMSASALADVADHGRSALVAFDASNGTLLARHEIPMAGEHVLGDFIFMDDENILVTDSIGGAVYTLNTVTGKYIERIAPGRLRSPQGLARIDCYVIISDYSNGLYRFDPSNGELLHIEDGPAAPYGIDGLYAHHGMLIGIHNGVRPYQVNRYVLNDAASRIVSRETLLANHAALDEPTLGAIFEGRFHLVANSLWNHVTPDGRLPEEHHSVPVILSIEIPRVNTPGD